MSRLNKLCLMVVFSGMTITVVPNLDAQIARKAYQATVGSVVKDVKETRRDYKLDKPFQYQPSDPWYRGKVFRLHTGHYGMFYNCDGEECKRESPYICWKVHHERDFPKYKGIRFYVKQDLNEISSRVGNGGCNPHAPCNACSDCTSGTCGCSTCVNGQGAHGHAHGEVILSAKAEPAAQSQAQVAPMGSAVSGLLSGRTRRHTSIRQAQVEEQNITRPEAVRTASTQNSALPCDCPKCRVKQR